MNEPASDRLLHPFATGLLPFPAAGARWLVIGAMADFRAPDGLAAELRFVQGFRPYFLTLERAGWTVVPAVDGTDYDGALVVAGRHRQENEDWLGQALARTRAGARIVVSGGKTDGIAPLMRKLAVLVPLQGHAAKFHGTVFWLERPPAIANDVLAAFSGKAAETEGFETPAGGFSAGRIDPGSALLAECLPADLSGRVADFGAAWGYLSVEAARKAPNIARIDLYEAHHAALEAARRNLAALAPALDCGFVWCDLTSEEAGRRYDAIVMNPPFHQGRRAEPDIGRTMIARAAGALKPGGRLFMVANRSLPYEKALAAAFASHAELADDGRFKVLAARR